MKLIKIGAIWCSGCLVMNKTWNKIISNYIFDYQELDYDIDAEEVAKYAVAEILPVFIVMDKDKEITRFVGELSYDEMVNKLKEVGIIDE